MRRWIVAAIAAAVMVSGAGAPAQARPAHTSGSGFTIRPDGRATGGWVGSWATSAHAPGYRVQPDALAGVAGYGTPRWAARVGGATAVRTANAAWIVSRFGRKVSKAQSAAVDVAVYATLYPGKLGLGSDRAQKRMRQTQHYDRVRSLASWMVQYAPKNAGPYRVAMSGPSKVDAASAPGTGFSARIVSRAGVGIAGLPVTARWGSGAAWSGTTNSKGRVAVTLSPGAGQVGRVPVTFTYSNLPSWKMRLLPSRKRSLSALVLAGQKASKVAAYPVGIVAHPRSAITGGVVGVGGIVPGRVTISGGANEVRTLTAWLYGPFSTAAAVAAARCAGTPIATVTRSVSANGAYAMPAVKSTRDGFYQWRVDVAASALNASAPSICGATSTVRSAPTVSAVATDAQVRVGAAVKVKLKVRKLPVSGYRNTVTGTLYGPYAEKSKIGCGDGKKVARRGVEIVRDGDYVTSTIKVSHAGWYAWVGRVPSSPLSLAAVSVCKATGSLVKVG